MRYLTWLLILYKFLVALLKSVKKKFRPDHGLFEKLFPSLTPCTPQDVDLNRLAESMTNRTDMADSRIPAGYTYLAQFIAHDISLDSGNKTDPWDPHGVQKIKNKRSPYFDLETIYGLPSPRNPDEPRRFQLMDGKAKLKLGRTNGESTGGSNTDFDNDLLRGDTSSRAVTVDQRNDDNLPVAQTTVAFIKFHNAIVDLVFRGRDDEVTFKRARKVAIRHYQWIVLHDFLKRIVQKDVLDAVLEKKSNQFYFPKRRNLFLPIEFSFAAFRWGHTMIRNEYNWNRVFNEEGIRPRASLDQLFKFTDRGGGLAVHKRIPSAWIINWNWFYDIDNSIETQKDKFNFAKKFDTTAAAILGYIRNKRPYEKFNFRMSLPAKDLYRCRLLQLPSGQTVAEEMNKTVPVRVLTPDQLAGVLRSDLGPIFSRETPLWFYILAEAEIESAAAGKDVLGDVGSWIVAETFITLLKISPFSILKDDLAQDRDFLGTNGNFGMPELLKFVASNNKKYDELNPLEPIKFKEKIK